MKILIVEDDEFIAHTLTAILTNQNYAVEVAFDGEAAWDLIDTFDYDLILLDVILPKIDGINLCQRIRSRGLQMPILLLTGCDRSHDKAIGLDAGADDYLVKPFDEEELVARLRALLRRGVVSTLPVLEWDKLRLDPTSCQVTYSSQLLSLTPKEYALLELFLRNSRRVFSCGMILEHLWSYEDTPGEEAVRTHIKGLRQKLKAVGAPSDLIETVYGIGYRLKPLPVTGDNNSKNKEETHSPQTQEQLSPSQPARVSMPSKPQTLNAIAGVWHRFKGRIEEQVGLLEKAAATVGAQHYCASGHQELLAAAQREAHTLAGSLGTFGFAQGSQLARKIETLLKDSHALTQQQKSEFQTSVELLRQEIQRSPLEEFPSSSGEEQPLLLIVDRDLALAPQLRQAATSQKIQISIVTNIADAQIQLYQQHPSVVLLDPTVAPDWSESLSFLEQLQQRKPPVPVIVFTGASDFSNRLQVARHGGHTFLQKPMPPEQVLETVQQVLQQSNQGEAQVLVVDDDPKTGAILQGLLRPWGLKVTALSDPRQFWHTLSAEQPDLLILDVEMPGISGIEICRVVRNEPRWSELPILFLTVHNDAEIVNQVFAVGADDFVSKPIVGPELAVRIINRLERMKLLRHMSNSHRSQVEQRENRWRAIFEAEPQCVKLIAVDGTLLEINPAGLAMRSLNSSDEVIGKSIYDDIAPEDRQAFRQLHLSVIQGNKGTLEYEMITPQGHRRWMETHSVPFKNEADGTCVHLAITRDIHECKQAAAELRRVNRTLKTLSECNQALVRATDESDLLVQICQIIVEIGGYRLAWVGFAAQDEAQSIHPAAQAGYEEGYLQSLHLSWAVSKQGQSPTGTAIRTGKPCIVQNILTDPRFEIWRQEAYHQGYAATISLPLMAESLSFGALSIYAAEPDAFDADEVKLLSKLAADLAYGIVALRTQRDRAAAQKNLQTRIQQQAIVAYLGQAALRGQDIFSLMNEAVALVAKNLEVEYCKLLQLLPDEKTLLLRAGVGWDEGLIGHKKVSLSDSQAGYTLLVKEPVIVEDMRTDNRFHCSELLHSSGAISGLSVPIAGANGVYGVLGAHTRKKQAFTQDDIYFLQAVANVLSGAIDRHNTEKYLRKSKDELELRVAERTAELIKINEQLQSELNERYLTQEALRISQARFAGIVNIADDAIISIDRNQRITLFNQGAEKIFGYKASEAIGQPLDLIIPLPFIQAHRHFVAEFGKSPTQSRRMGERREIYGRRKDGTEFPAEASISKLDLGDEKVYTVFLQDITDRKQVEKMKDEFVSVVSHELRTPLTSIHGSLGMLASGMLPPASEAGKRLLEIAVDSTDRLVRLINDILDIERIESGKVKMEKQACKMGEIIQQAVNVMQSLADKAGITLAVETLAVNEIATLADSDRIVQTLTNLLSNAIKFSPRGSTVWLNAELEAALEHGGTEPGGEYSPIPGAPYPSASPMPGAPYVPALLPHTDAILFAVKDQGRGIPADKLDSIFERFQQVDSSDSRNHDGTGLGLAICRSIVQQHGGRIWVDSILGEGSSFYFTLPIIPQTPNVDAADAEGKTSPLVLVCDDDPAIHTELQILLQKRGYRVITVDSGEAAIKQAAAQQPDVILLDLMMPGMNGWETMAVLKQREDTKDIPIVICSVYQPTETSQPRTDFVDWVSKPLDEISLFHSLSRVIAGGKVRVLVVENDTDLAEVLIHLLEQHDIETFHAKTGREAIRLSQEVNPDLLVLNLILPEVDGFAVVDWLQQHNRLCSTPLVVYSTKDLDESERQRLKLGHTEFLSKGQVTTQEFEQRVMELLHCMTGAGDWGCWGPHEVGIRGMGTGD
jgi:PAS domain S-box-containing protein